jgi:outer membrane protein OmpA-like peptidoglycan-associated protein
MKNQNLTAMLVEQQKIQATMQGSLTAMKGTISEEALKGQARQLELQSRIDRMEDINTKFEQMQRIFSSEEAQVFRQENDVIIRMIGINFDVSKSEIKPEDYPLLTKVKKAMDLFDNASIVIEGHTDSQGGDDSNLKLSQERADAVLSYLSANTTIDKSRFSTEGFGESKPVANNETTAGRKLNRRIDIVIKPTYSDIATPMLGSLKE